MIFFPGMEKWKTLLWFTTTSRVTQEGLDSCTCGTFLMRKKLSMMLMAQNLMGVQFESITALLSGLILLLPVFIWEGLHGKMPTFCIGFRKAFFPSNCLSRIFKCILYRSMMTILFSGVVRVGAHRHQGVDIHVRAPEALIRKTFAFIVSHLSLD